MIAPIQVGRVPIYCKVCVGSMLATERYVHAGVPAGHNDAVFSHRFIIFITSLSHRFMIIASPLDLLRDRPRRLQAERIEDLPACTASRFHTLLLPPCNLLSFRYQNRNDQF